MESYFRTAPESCAQPEKRREKIQTTYPDHSALEQLRLEQCKTNSLHGGLSCIIILLCVG